MKVAILTTPNQWFVSYAQTFAANIGCPLFFKHEDIGSEYDTVFVLSYHRIIGEQFLSQHKHNLVVHASDLPHGKGWAPLTWQILEGQTEVVFTLFEADAKTDNGPYYLKKTLSFTGYELGPELRHIQAQACIDMCQEFVQKYEQLKPIEQQGEESFYAKRGPQDSELNINKTIAEQFNLLRVVDNESYPAFFYKDGHKYLIKIYHAPEE